MRIAYDCRHLQKHHLDDGASRYSYDLLSAIISLDKSFELYYLGYNNLDPKDQLQGLLNKGGVFIPAFDKHKSTLINYALTQTTFPSLLKKHKIDLYHSLFQTDGLALSSVPQLITVHDLGPYYSYPDYLRLNIETALNIKIPKGFRNTIRFKIIRRAKTVLADSKFTENQLINLNYARPENIVIVYPGLNLKFSQPDKDSDNIRKAYEINEPYIFMVGRIQPYKNVLGAIEAFKILHDENHFKGSLLIAGQAKGYEEINYQEKCQKAVIDFGMEEKVRFLGYIPDNAIKALYAKAAVFLQPSFLEGFGFPPLEAALSGAPVVISNIGSLPEIIPQAIKVSPFNARDIASGLMEALHLNSRINVEWNTWEETAKKVISLYKNGQENY